MKTPFDELRVLFSINYPPPIPPDINKVINSFVTILRALYVSQAENANTFLFSSRTPLTDEAAEAINDAYILCRLSYFQFIEQINIFGRILNKRKCPVLPQYYRIYFFRNKIVEHWDEYMQFIPFNTVQMSSVKRTATVLIPYHMGRGVIPDHRALTRDNLIRTFKKHGITLYIDDNDWYEIYSQKVFLALEAIDGRLSRNKIPEEIVKALFDYMFPTPITDLETYSLDLANTLKSIIP